MKILKTAARGVLSCVMYFIMFILIGMIMIVPVRALVGGGTFAESVINTIVQYLCMVIASGMFLRQYAEAKTNYLNSIKGSAWDFKSDALYILKNQEFWIMTVTFIIVISVIPILSGSVSRFYLNLFFADGTERWHSHSSIKQIGCAVLFAGVPYTIFYFAEWIIMHKRWSDSRIRKD